MCPVLAPLSESATYDDVHGLWLVGGFYANHGYTRLAAAGWRREQRATNIFGFLDVCFVFIFAAFYFGTPPPPPPPPPAVDGRGQCVRRVRAHRSRCLCRPFPCGGHTAPVAGRLRSEFRAAVRTREPVVDARPSDIECFSRTKPTEKLIKCIYSETLRILHVRWRTPGVAEFFSGRVPIFCS